MTDHTARLCRFSDSNEPHLLFEEANLQQSKYFAISHVWGSPDEVAPRELPGLLNGSRHIELSEWKLAFIKHELRRHVGTYPFWMDILCINQDDADEKIKVIGQIPHIFAYASKVIVIRDGDGLPQCCVESLGDMRQGYQGLHKHQLSHHSPYDCFPESYLQRLWTLQELSLCRRIQFSSCKGWVAESRTSDPKEGTLSFLQMLDRLRALAYAWVNPESQHGSFEEKEREFMLSFLTNGTITRTDAPAPDRQISPSEDQLLLQEQNSTRVATEPEDYIFGVMPQYRWWSMTFQERKGLKEMGTFSQLFNEVQTKASRAGHGYYGKFTRGMVESGVLDPSSSWLPSLEIPTPQSLGDFVKLLGGPVRPCPSGTHGILMNRVKSYELRDNLPVEAVLTIIKAAMEFSKIKAAMEFSKTAWSLAQRGELSQHGMFPPERCTVVRLDDSPDSGRSDITWCIPNVADYVRNMENDVIQATSLMFSGVGLGNFQGPGLESEWEHYRNYLVASPSPLYRQGMMTVAAMIGCSIGLSALHWVRERFSPVLLELYKNRYVLGLVSTSYVEEFTAESGDCNLGGASSMLFYCVQRGGQPNTGRDIVLVPSRGSSPDADGKDMFGHPVGLCPLLQANYVGDGRMEILQAYRHDALLNGQGQTVVSPKRTIYV